MPGLYDPPSRAQGEILTAEKYNDDHDTHWENHVPPMIDDYSASVAQMRTQTDPGELGSESLPTNLAGELERMRYAIWDAKRAVDRSVTYWYESPPQSQVYNVRAYGAVGDGAVDDTAALNAVMATVNAAGGGAVSMPAGTYRLTDSIRVPSNTVVYGDGRHTVLSMDSTMTTCAFENWGYDTLSADRNITIRHLAVNGNRATPPGTWVSVANAWQPSRSYALGYYVANTTSGYRVYQCATAGTSGAAPGPTGTGTGIVDGSCVWSYVEDFWTEASIPGGHQAAVLLSRVRNALIEDLSCYMSRDNAVIFELCQHAKMVNCHCEDINKNCLYSSASEHTVCVGNTFEYCYGGATYASDWYGTIVGNTVRHCMNAFITLARDTQFASVVGNSGGNTTDGVLSGGGDLLAIGESLTGTNHGKTYPGAHGDYEYGCNNCVIASNVLTRIQLDVSNDNLIVGNVVANSWRDGIHLLGSSNNRIVLNRVYNGATSAAPWAFANLQTTAGALQGTVQSVQNRYLYNTVHDDRSNDGLQRWGFTFSGSPAFLELHGNTVQLDDSVTLPIRFYNWNVDYGVFKDNYYGTVAGLGRFLPTGTPTAREELRGDVYTIPGAAGVRDTQYMVEKDASNAYGLQLVPLGLRCLGVGSITWDPPSVADNGSAAATVTVTGAQPGDLCLAGFSAITTANWTLTAQVQSANTARVVIVNKTGGAVDLGSGTLTVAVFRPT